jgi:5-methylcytosine-specific restriction enzyme A
MAERLRGRRAVAQRRRRLRAEPLCRDCAVRSIVREATVPDHIVPLAHGGSDQDCNIRCLCAECHSKRTAEQFGLRRKVRIGADGWPAE